MRLAPLIFIIGTFVLALVALLIQSYRGGPKITTINENGKVANPIWKFISWPLRIIGVAIGAMFIPTTFNEGEKDFQKPKDKFKAWTQRVWKSFFGSKK